MLGDATGLAGHDVGVADLVEQRGLAVVDVTHDGDDRGARHLQRLVVVVAVVEHRLQLELFLLTGLDQQQVGADLEREQLHLLVGERHGGRDHLAVLQQEADDVGRGAVQLGSELLGRHATLDDDRALGHRARWWWCSCQLYVRLHARRSHDDDEHGSSCAGRGAGRWGEGRHHRGAGHRGHHRDRHRGHRATGTRAAEAATGTRGTEATGTSTAGPAGRGPPGPVRVAARAAGTGAVATAGTRTAGSAGASTGRRRGTKPAGRRRNRAAGRRHRAAATGRRRDGATESTVAGRAGGGAAGRAAGGRSGRCRSRCGAAGGRAAGGRATFGGQRPRCDGSDGGDVRGGRWRQRRPRRAERPGARRATGRLLVIRRGSSILVDDRRRRAGADFGSGGLDDRRRCGGFGCGCRRTGATTTGGSVRRSTARLWLRLDLGGSWRRLLGGEPSSPVPRRRHRRRHGCFGGRGLGRRGLLGRRLLGRLGLLGLLGPSQTVTFGATTETIGLCLDERGGVALHPDAHRVAAAPSSRRSSFRALWRARVRGCSSPKPVQPFVGVGVSGRLFRRPIILSCW